MRRVLERYLSFSQHYKAWLSILCAMSVVLPAIIFPSSALAAYAHAHSNHNVTACNNPSQPAPSDNSLLVVLLDRSGSLVADSGATDPDLYSASVTRALADLWPGKMAVVAFNTINPSGNDEQVQLKILGPNQVGGDQAGRDELKTEIQNLPRPALGTPTGPAMDKALEIIKNQGAPLSKVVLITDGAPGYQSNDANQSDPHGTKEEAHIRTLLPQFCAASIPVDTVGLQTDAGASQFLSDIATGTGGQPRHVQDPGDLANAVLSLYGQWQQNHQTFQPLQLQADNTYHVTVGPLVRSLNFFVFRSKNKVVVNGPDGGQPLPLVENSTDAHYVYDTLSLTPPRKDGDYTIDVGGDSQAQVYAFLTSSLGVRIDTSTQLAINQPLSIQARLLNDQALLSPLDPGATLNAYVTFTTSGQSPKLEQLPLMQQGKQNLFTGTTASTYPQAGQLQVVVVANYSGGVRAQSDEALSVVCGFSVVCIFKQYQTAFLIASPFPALLLLALIAWLIWNQQPAPFGTLRTPPSPRRRRRRDDDDDDDEVTVSLPHIEAGHPWRQRLSQRSILTSSDIQTHRDAKGGFDFDLASFDLQFQRNRTVKLKSTSMEQIIIVKHSEDQTEEPQKQGVNTLLENDVGGAKGKQKGPKKETLEQGESTFLKGGDVIHVANKDRAIFSEH